MKTLNLLNPGITKNVDSPTEITERDFWEYYLNFLMADKGNFLTNMETKLVAVILAKDPTICYFTKPHSDEVMDELDIKYSYLHVLKNSLVEKGMVINTKGRKYFLNPKLRKFQEAVKDYFKKDSNIEFKFVFTIKDYEKGFDTTGERVRGEVQLQA